MILKKKILIDLDGVLNEYGKEKFDENHIPNIKNNAYEFIKELSETFELYLFTSRNMILSVKWLIKNNLDVYFKDLTNIKILHTLYIDDKAICFNGDYKKTIHDIKKFKVHWKY